MRLINTSQTTRLSKSGFTLIGALVNSLAISAAITATVAIQNQLNESVVASNAITEFRITLETIEKRLEKDCDTYLLNQPTTGLSKVDIIDPDYVPPKIGMPGYGQSPVHLLEESLAYGDVIVEELRLEQDASSISPKAFHLRVYARTRDGLPFRHLNSRIPLLVEVNANQVEHCGVVGTQAAQALIHSSSVTTKEELTKAVVTSPGSILFHEDLRGYAVQTLLDWKIVGEY